ncbi:fasciclin domain-containing protein [Arhodomonas sp. SL1]|uniref:fasciclin domain-containing protein n=1 Tax=Arhodomonas sp. SL1 TaxID=3425691 RepID=UPI003F88377C
MRTTPLRLLLATALTFGLAGTLYAGNHEDEEKEKAAGDIVDVATGAGQFETLLAALEAAGLSDTLRGEGPFTVFAPTDDAFAALPEGTVESLLEQGNRDQLTGILTYHVVPAKVTAAQAMETDSAETVHGGTLRISTMDGKVMINDATVIQADVMADNGVIHVIDSVLMPE